MMRLASCLLALTYLSSYASAQPQAVAHETALRDIQLPVQVKNDISKVVISDDFDDSVGDDNQQQQLALESRAQILDVGFSIILVKAGPGNPTSGATGNGSVWIFKRVGNHAVLILSGFGSMVSVRSESHHGVHDISIYANSSCCEGGVEIYAYNGVKYAPRLCYAVTQNEDGTATDGPPGKCDE